METCGAVAEFDKVSGKLTLWCTTQAPHAHRTVYALLTGLPEHKIRVISPDVGGGFGNKVPVYPGYVCAIVGSIVTGRPVKWMEDRSENLMSTGFARDYVMRGAIAATREGKILARRGSTCSPTTARSTPTAQPTKFPAGFFHVFTGSYDLEAAYCQRHAACTRTRRPAGSRYSCSFRVTEAVYLVERLVDCLAHELGIDPARAAAREPDRARAVPVPVQDRLGVRLGRLRAGAAQGAGERRLRRAAPRAGRAARARRADGDRRRRSSPRRSAPARASTWTSSGSG